jgi:hypothetical protein
MSHLRLALLCTILGSAALLQTACQPGPREETTLFEQAEQHYRSGHYDRANTRYKEFLQRYPRSPLVRTAELRLRTIDREVESIMGRSGDGNRPIYMRPGASPKRADQAPQGAPGDDLTAPEPDAAKAPSP